MFDRPHHRRVAEVLRALDSELLVRHRALFGGGTAISLSKGEYRESVDIDLICSSIEGYRGLRGLVHGEGISKLLTSTVELAREPRIDQYGIRCAFRVDGVAIKFEIVYEGRVELAPPDAGQRICGVWTLSHEDRVATKLMANSDRWADDSVLSRDLIDLAMLCDDGIVDPAGVAKAVRAYGTSVILDLSKARTRLLGREGRLGDCMKLMGMRMPERDLVERIGALSAPAPASEPHGAGASGKDSQRSNGPVRP